LKFRGTGLLFWALLGILVLPVSGKTARPGLEDTRQWIGLSRIWREMTDHWSGKVYSAEKFSELGDTLRAELPDLQTLAAEHYFPPEIRIKLEEIFIRRYLFIQGQFYIPATDLNLADLDRYAFSAQTNIENLLKLLGTPAAQPEKDKAKILNKARDNLAVEVEFFTRALSLKQEIDRRRQEGEKRSAEGGEVNWEQFNMQAVARSRALIDDYCGGKIKPGRTSYQVRDLLLSLTEPPLPPEAVGESAPTPPPPALPPTEK
jgi:hypothetical protein